MPEKRMHIDSYSGTEYRGYSFNFEVTEELEEKVMALAGVAIVMRARYSLTVQKGFLFKWETLEPEITKVIREVSGV